VMRALAPAAAAASCALAAERGSHPALPVGAPARRNASLLAIAPTGTIRLLASCSGGLEPLLAPVVRVRGAGASLRACDEEVVRFLTRRGVAQAGLAALERGAGFGELPGLDAASRELLRRGHELDPELQLAVQARFQRHVDGAISKTVHLPADASVEQIEALVMRACELGCKGAAFYLGGSLAAPEIELSALACAECEI